MAKKEKKFHETKNSDWNTDLNLTEILVGI